MGRGGGNGYLSFVPVQWERLFFRSGPPPNTHTHTLQSSGTMTLINSSLRKIYRYLISYNQLIYLPIKNHRRLYLSIEKCNESPNQVLFFLTIQRISLTDIFNKFPVLQMSYCLIECNMCNSVFVKYTISSSSSCIHTPCNIYSKQNLLSQVSSLSVLIINIFFNYLTNNCTNKEMLTW